MICRSSFVKGPFSILLNPSMYYKNSVNTSCKAYTCNKTKLYLNEWQWYAFNMENEIHLKCFKTKIIFLSKLNNKGIFFS